MIYVEILFYSLDHIYAPFATKGWHIMYMSSKVTDHFLQTLRISYLIIFSDICSVLKCVEGGGQFLKEHTVAIHINYIYYKSYLIIFSVLKCVEGSF